MPDNQDIAEMTVPDNGTPATTPVVIGAPEEAAASTAEVTPLAPAESLLERLQALEVLMRAHVQAMQAAADRLAQNAEVRDDDNRTRDALLEKLDASKSTFQFQLIKPMVTRLASLHDLVVTWTESPPADAAGFTKCLDILSKQFRETLDMFGIQILNPQVNESFDRRFHHVMDTIATAEQEKHERVAATLQHGFLYFGQNERTGVLVPTLVRPARVKTWKYDAALVQAPEPAKAAATED